ncbi:hypothetical protein [Streptomyces sp. TRM64462]|uniref:hypothetical protein n=1 Tax=Streptomyces sp. TRM64462 TaxID=2741726 RepID=UPI001586A748|nr:hypothetical protein [Streptomyces sp. TRM64462]
MARVVLDDRDIVFRLAWWEWPAARRREVRVPVSALRDAHVEPDWWRALRGEAGRGLWLPGRCVGVRHLPEGRDFVAVRAGRPVLCVDLRRGAPFLRLAASVPDAEAALETLLPLVPRDRLD